MITLEMLVQEFVFDCRIRSLSDMTIRNYQKQLNSFLLFLDNYCAVRSLEELKPQHIKLFIRHYQERQCKASYINDLLKAIKVLCAYAHREEYTEELLTKKISNVKEPIPSYLSSHLCSSADTEWA